LVKTLLRRRSRSACLGTRLSTPSQSKLCAQCLLCSQRKTGRLSDSGSPRGPGALWPAEG